MYYQFFIYIEHKETRKDAFYPNIIYNEWYDFHNYKLH